MSSILIVENNTALRQSFGAILKIYLPALSIGEAADSTEALQMISASPPDIIFIDLHLPNANGPRLARAIKATQPEIVVAVFTSYDLPEYRYDEYQLKADHLLTMDSMSGASMAALISSILGQKEVDAMGPSWGGDKAVHPN